MTHSLPLRMWGTWLLAGLLAGMIGSGVAAPAPKGPEGFQTAATHAILIEADSGSVLFEKTSDELAAPASLSKLMTAELVFHTIREGRLKPTDEFTVSENAWRKGGGPSRTSSMFVAVRSRVSVDALLHGVIIQSGNDACITLAEGIAGSEDRFAELMTERARELGLDKSTFGNSTGLPNPRQRMTARELGKLARHIILTYPEYYKLFSEREFTHNKIRQTNRNPLLSMELGADGLKTGYIKESGYSLVGSAVQNGLRLIVVVLGLRNEKERSDEARKLLEWGFHNFESGQIFEGGETIADAKVYGGAHGSVALVADRPIKLMLPRNGPRERLTARVTYSGPVRPPVQKGQQIGLLKVWRGDTMVLEVPLQAAADVDQGNLPRRAWDAAAELFIGLFRAGVQRL